MKTIGSILLIVFVAVLMLNGLVLIFNQAGVNSDLDAESLNLIEQYDAEFQQFNNNITLNYNVSRNLTGFEPNNDQIGNEAKEFFTTKSKIDQLRNTVSLAVNLPEIFFLAIPFVDEDDLDIYKTVLGFLVIITIFIALILAIFGRFWEK